MVGKPCDWGVSRTIRKIKRATATASSPGKKSMECQSAKIAMPRMVTGPTMPPPILWPTFHRAILVPRSLGENQ